MGSFSATLTQLRLQRYYFFCIYASISPKIVQKSAFRNVMALIGWFYGFETQKPNYWGLHM